MTHLATRNNNIVTAKVRSHLHKRNPHFSARAITVNFLSSVSEMYQDGVFSLANNL